MTTAVIYTRFSPRPNAQECQSNEKQEERCRAYCQNMGYQVVAIHADEAVTGGVFQRPELSKAIEKIHDCIAEEDEPVAFVVDSVDRLSRDMLVALTIRHEVERAGGRIEYANGTPAATTPEGELFSNILAAFAAYERSRIKHATSRGIKRRQANGEWFGKPPVGYMRDPNDSKKLVECPEEQAAITRAKFLHSQGFLTSEEIAQTLTEVYGPFRGNHWSARTVRKILAKQD